MVQEHHIQLMDLHQHPDQKVVRVTIVAVALAAVAKMLDWITSLHPKLVPSTLTIWGRQAFDKECE